MECSPRRLRVKQPINYKKMAEGLHIQKLQTIANNQADSTPAGAPATSKQQQHVIQQS